MRDPTDHATRCGNRDLFTAHAKAVADEDRLQDEVQRQPGGVVRDALCREQSLERAGLSERVPQRVAIVGRSTDG